MAVIHRNQKWLYLCEPHTASRATIRLLFTIGGQSIGQHHATVRHLKGERLDDFDIICTVRNPLDTLVTKWLRNNHEGLNFDYWVDKHINNPVVKEPLRGIWREANIYMWYENLQQDLWWVFHRTEINGQDLVLSYDRDHKTRGKRTGQQKTWRDHMNDFTFNRLMARYRWFLDDFGYQIEDDGTTRIDPHAVVDKCRQLRYHKP